MSMNAWLISPDLPVNTEAFCFLCPCASAFISLCTRPSVDSSPNDTNNGLRNGLMICPYRRNRSGVPLKENVTQED